MINLCINDTQPQVSEKNSDGKQKISLYDSAIGANRIIVADSDKIDEFLTTRKNEAQKGCKKCIADTVIAGITTIVAAGATLILGKHLKSDKIVAAAGITSIIGSIVTMVAPLLDIFSLNSNLNKQTQNFINENK